MLICCSKNGSSNPVNTGEVWGDESSMPKKFETKIQTQLSIENFVLIGTSIRSYLSTKPSLKPRFENSVFLSVVSKSVVSGKTHF